MITREHKCSVCHHIFTVTKSIKEKVYESCVACGQETEVVIYGGTGFSIDMGPKTLGQQAERNAKKFGKNKCQELDAENAKRAYQRDPQQEKISKILAGGQDRVDRYIRTGK